MYQQPTAFFVASGSAVRTSYTHFTKRPHPWTTPKHFAFIQQPLHQATTPVDRTQTVCVYSTIQKSYPQLCTNNSRETNIPNKIIYKCKHLDCQSTRRCLT